MHQPFPVEHAGRDVVLLVIGCFLRDQIRSRILCNSPSQLLILDVLSTAPLSACMVLNTIVLYAFDSDTYLVISTLTGLAHICLLYFEITRIKYKGCYRIPTANLITPIIESITHDSHSSDERQTSCLYRIIAGLVGSLLGYPLGLWMASLGFDSYTFNKPSYRCLLRPLNYEDIAEQITIILVEFAGTLIACYVYITVVSDMRLKSTTRLERRKGAEKVNETEIGKEIAGARSFRVDGVLGCLDTYEWGVRLVITATLSSYGYRAVQLNPALAMPMFFSCPTDTLDVLCHFVGPFIAALTVHYWFKDSLCQSLQFISAKPPLPVEKSKTLRSGETQNAQMAPIVSNVEAEAGAECENKTYEVRGDEFQMPKGTNNSCYADNLNRNMSSLSNANSNGCRLYAPVFQNDQNPQLIQYCTNLMQQQQQQHQPRMMQQQGGFGNQQQNDFRNHQNGYGNQRQNGYGNHQQNGYGNQQQNEYGNQQQNEYGNQQQNEYENQQQNGYGNHQQNGYGNQQQNGRGSEAIDAQMTRSMYNGMNRLNYTFDVPKDIVSKGVRLRHVVMMEEILLSDNKARSRDNDDDADDARPAITSSKHKNNHHMRGNLKHSHRKPAESDTSTALSETSVDEAQRKSDPDDNKRDSQKNYKRSSSKSNESTYGGSTDTEGERKSVKRGIKGTDKKEGESDTRNSKDKNNKRDSPKNKRSSSKSNESTDGWSTDREGERKSLKRGSKGKDNEERKSDTRSSRNEENKRGSKDKDRPSKAVTRTSSSSNENLSLSKAPVRKTNTIGSTNKENESLNNANSTLSLATVEAIRKLLQEAADEKLQSADMTNKPVSLTSNQQQEKNQNKGSQLLPTAEMSVGANSTREISDSKQMRSSTSERNIDLYRATITTDRCETGATEILGDERQCRFDIGDGSDTRTLSRKTTDSSLVTDSTPFINILQRNKLSNRAENLTRQTAADFLLQSRVPAAPRTSPAKSRLYGVDVSNMPVVVRKNIENFAKLFMDREKPRTTRC